VRQCREGQGSNCFQVALLERCWAQLRRTTQALSNRLGHLRRPFLPYSGSQQNVEIKSLTNAATAQLQWWDLRRFCGVSLLHLLLLLNSFFAGHAVGPATRRTAKLSSPSSAIFWFVTNEVGLLRPV
jgi:hypothetical protein